MSQGHLITPVTKAIPIHWKSSWVLAAATIVVLATSLLQQPLGPDSAWVRAFKITSSVTEAASASKRQQHRAERSAKDSLLFLNQRQQTYVSAGFGQNWHLRDIAHLYTHRNVLLVGQHIPPAISSINQTHVIRIDNVYSQIHPKANIPSCSRLSMWVRVRGPEIFAWKAQPRQPGSSEEHCYWTFSFEARVPGNYTIDAKVLLWDAYQHARNESCTIQKGPVPSEILQRYPVHAGFKGFKLYDAPISCCEFCNRQQHFPKCRYWSTPPEKLMLPSNPNNGCEFYFESNVTNEQLPFQSYLLGDLETTGLLKKPEQPILKGNSTTPEFPQFHGYPQEPRDKNEGKNNFAYFVGCGWQQMFTLDFPCLSAHLDDKVYMLQETFTVVKNESSSELSELSSKEELPMCTLEHELIGGPSVGRWVKKPWPTDCPNPLIFTPQYMVTVDNNPQHPHCWHREDLSKLGLNCIEMNCRLIPELSKYKTDFRDPRWFGVWRRYDCNYLEFTQDQLQQCVDTLRIKKFQFHGVSVAHMTFEFLKERIKNIKLYEGPGGGRTATLSTLGLLHRTKLVDDAVDKWFHELPPHPSSDDLFFVMSPFFVTSEREVFAHLEIMMKFDAIIKQDLVSSKGFRYLNALDMSAAMSYETATQLDGMHIMGPTAKMVVTKFLHHLCSANVSGHIF